MSITKTRNFIEKSGCGLFVGIVIILVLIVGFIYQFGGAAGGPAQGPEGQGPVVAKVGEYVVGESDVIQSLEQKEQQFGGLTPLQRAYTTAQALYELVNNGLTLDLAKEKGINPTDEQILDTAKTQLENSVNEQRMQLMMQGRLKPDATDKDFADAFKQAFGMDPKEAVAKQLETIKDRMNDPSLRSNLAAAAAGPMVLAAIQNGIQPTDEEVRKANGTLVTKAITFSSNPEAEEKAKKVLAEIKAGLAFEAAMERYSVTPAEKGKKKSDATEEVSMFSVLFSPAYKSLKDAKPGTVSDVVNVGVPKIYKVVKVKEMSKADYEKDKVAKRQTFVQSRANLEFGEQLNARRSKVQWESDGYRLLHDLYATLNDTTLKAPEVTKKITAIREELKEVVDRGRDAIGGSAANQALYASTEVLWQRVSPEEKKKLEADRIEILESVYKRDADPQIAMTLVDMFIARKDKKAGDYLLRVAEANRAFEPPNQTTFTDVAAKLQKMKKLGLVTPEEEKLILAEQKRWTTEKLEDDKLKAEQAAEEKKRQAEFEKQQAEEKKKNEGAEVGKTPKGPLRPRDEPKKAEPEKTTAATTG